MDSPDIEKKNHPRLEWESLGKRPIDTSQQELSYLLHQRGMIGDNQVLETGVFEELAELKKQSGIIRGRVFSIVLTKIGNQRGNIADVYVTKLEVKYLGDEPVLVPEDRFQTRKQTEGYSPSKLLESLSKDKNGVYFVVDDR